MDQATRIPTPDEQPWLTVPEAGRLLAGLGRAASYDAAKRGDLPTIRIGERRLVVPTAHLRALLGLDVDRRTERPTATAQTGWSERPRPVAPGAAKTTAASRAERISNQETTPGAGKRPG